MVVCVALHQNVYANTMDGENVTVNAITANGEQVNYSQEMTSEEIISMFAEENNVSLDKARQELFGRMKLRTNSLTATSYRELTVVLNVTPEYKPTLRFYCSVSQGGNYWGILDILSVQLDCNYRGTAKQFSGNVEAHLLSAYQILYIVNGTFYHYGTTTVTSSVSSSVNAGVASATYNVSEESSSYYYKYYYYSDSISFQK